MKTKSIFFPIFLGILSIFLNSCGNITEQTAKPDPTCSCWWLESWQPIGTTIYEKAIIRPADCSTYYQERAWVKLEDNPFSNGLNYYVSILRNDTHITNDNNPNTFQPHLNIVIPPQITNPPNIQTDYRGQNASTLINIDHCACEDLNLGCSVAIADDPVTND